MWCQRPWYNPHVTCVDGLCILQPGHIRGVEGGPKRYFMISQMDDRRKNKNFLEKQVTFLTLHPIRLHRSIPTGHTASERLWSQYDPNTALDFISLTEKTCGQDGHCSGCVRASRQDRRDPVSERRRFNRKTKSGNFLRKFCARQTIYHQCEKMCFLFFVFTVSKHNFLVVLSDNTNAKEQIFVKHKSCMEMAEGEVQTQCSHAREITLMRM